MLNVDAGDVFFGLAATERAVKSARLDQYRIVYFATHGLVAGELKDFASAEAEPALALTMPDNPSGFDDGLLQASEVAQLKLDADWVVLSACNTAAEEGPGAEALSGLAKAFIYAGARSLIVSHWKVHDEMTARLMTSIFKLHSQRPELSQAQVQQQATLALLSQLSEAESHPLFWAPFVVVGGHAATRP